MKNLKPLLFFTTGYLLFSCTSTTISLPPSPARPEMHNAIELNVASNDSIYLEGDAVRNMNELEQQLLETGMDSTRIISIQADSMAHMGPVKKIIALCSKNKWRVVLKQERR